MATPGCIYGHCRWAVLTYLPVLVGCLAPAQLVRLGSSGAEMGRYQQSWLVVALAIQRDSRGPLESLHQSRPLFSFPCFLPKQISSDHVFVIVE